MKIQFVALFFILISFQSLAQSKKRLKLKAESCYGKKDYACAEEALLAAIKLDSSDNILLNNLAVVQQLQSKNDSALATYSKVLELEPDDIFALIGKASILGYFKKYEEALYLLNKANQISSLNETVLLVRSEVYRHLKNPGAAMSDLKSVLQINPKQYKARLNIAFIKKDEGDSIGSKVDFVSLLLESPEDVISLNALAEIELYNTNYKEALEYTNKAILINSKYVNAYLTRGKIELKLDQREMACKDFHFAKRFASDDLKECIQGYLEDCEE